MRIYNVNSKKLPLLEVYDGGAMFIGSYVLQILLQFVFSLILVVTKVDQAFTATMIGICIIATINEGSILLTPIAYSKIRGQNIIAGTGYKKGLNLKQVLIVIALSVATICAFAPIADGFVQLITLAGYNVDSLTQLKMDSTANYIIAIFFVCALPALCEELLYRGIIARSFADKGFVFGIFLSGFFFAIMHGNPVQLVHQFCLGCVCATVYFATRSIWAPVIIHFLNNFIAITGNFIMFKTGAVATTTPWWASVIMCVVGLVAVGLLLWALVGKALSQTDKSLALGKRLEGAFAQLFRTKEEKEIVLSEEQFLQSELAKCDSQEMREVYVSAYKDDKKKIDKRNNRAIIYALIIGLAVWIMNTALGFMK
ncbi:MAG: type II CAAX endopeptidase family protein [Clostridia bacterium]